MINALRNGYKGANDRSTPRLELKENEFLELAPEENWFSYKNECIINRIYQEDKKESLARIEELIDQSRFGYKWYDDKTYYFDTHFPSTFDEFTVYDLNESMQLTFDKNK